MILLINLSLGYSSLKSLDILGVHSLRAKILAAISFPCHFPLHVSPLGLKMFCSNIFKTLCWYLRGCNFCVKVQFVDIDSLVS